MRQLTPHVTKKVSDAWGGESLVTLTDYEITEEDIGRTKPHYLGHRHKEYTFTQKDVGRKIREDSEPGGSWYFFT